MLSQLLPFVYTTTTVTTDDLEEFSEPLYDQVHPDHIAASEMPENIADIPVVHEQVIVGLRPERLVDARAPQGGLERAAYPRSEAPLLSPVVMVQETAHDDITAAFLLTQSLRQRQEEVEDAAMGREEDLEEDDQMLEYFCEDCVFLEIRNHEWQSLGHGDATLLRHSNGAVFFPFWQHEQLIADDVVQSWWSSTRASTCSRRRRACLGVVGPRLRGWSLRFPPRGAVCVAGGGPQVPRRVGGYGVRCLASPHPILGAMVGTWTLFLAPCIWQSIVRCLSPQSVCMRISGR